MPFSEELAEGLAKTGSSDLIRFTYGPKEWSPNGIRDYVERRFLSSSDRTPFVMIDVKNQHVVGFTAFINIDVSDQRVEIGPTWISKAYQGSKINAESKYLMLAHAFEAQGVRRVEFYCDGDNIAAKRALMRIGATLEGVKRKHTRRTDGSIRNTMLFSILDTEWESVCDRLKRRLYPDDYPMHSGRISIRSSQPADLGGIWEVERSAFGVGYSYGTLHQFYELFGDLLLVAETSDGVIVGYVLAGISTRDNVAWILNIGVRQEFQHRGIGKELMTNIIRELRAHDCTLVSLTVHPDNRNAIHLYEKLNFVVSKQVDDYYGPDTPRSVMTLILS